jgi:CheY-like chemotaxis protein
VGQLIPQQKPRVPQQLTQRDDAKKVVSEILKRVDQLINKGDLSRAQAEIAKAKEVDPRNVYVFALEERIALLMEESPSPEESRDKIEPISDPAIEQRSETEPETNQFQSRKLTLTDSVPGPAATSSLYSSLTFTPPDDTHSHEENMPDRTDEWESYRTAAAQAWVDGALTESEERQLNNLRMLFDISKDKTDQIEQSVRLECYRNALHRLLSDRSAERLNPSALADLQQRFHISTEEHLQLQAQLITTFSEKNRDKVLVIDDDLRLLELLGAALEDNGFDVTAISTSDEAFTLLRKFTPDLILCDINLETSTMGGFTFYEKVQELKHIQSIPFIFLTGLTDESLVRTGKELGVDEYLMKPISEQTLVSTLRGKLKRFRQLSKTLSGQSLSMAAA